MRILLVSLGAQLALGLYALTLRAWCWVSDGNSYDIAKQWNIDFGRRQGEKLLTEEEWTVIERYHTGESRYVPEPYRCDNLGRILPRGESCKLWARALMVERKALKSLTAEETRSNEAWTGAIMSDYAGPSDYDAPEDNSEISPAGRTTPPKTMTANE